MLHRWAERVLSASGVICLFGPFGTLVPAGVSAAPMAISPSVLDAPSESFPQALRPGLASATTALFEHRYSDAEALARKVLEEAPNSPDAWQILGYALANLERYDEAIAALGRAGDLYSENAVPLVTQGEIYMYLGRQPEAKGAFERAIEVDPDNRRALEQLAGFAQQAGERETAIGYYERAVAQLAPDELGARPELAALYVSAGDPGAARALLSGWAELPPGTPDRVVALLGRASAELGDTASARRYFESRTSGDASLASYVDLATFERNELDFAAAAEVLQRAAERYPDSPVPWSELGRTYGGQGSYEAALDAFNKGLAIVPDEPVLLRGARLALFRLGRLDAAHEIGMQLVSQDGADSSDYVWLGTIERGRGNREAAIAAYQSAVDADAANWVAHNNLAALVTDTDASRALMHARAAEALAPEVESVRDTLGWALFQSGDLDGARRVFAALTKEAPDNAVAAYHHGRVLLALGKSDEGRAELRRALELDASFSHADDARRLLTD